MFEIRTGLVLSFPARDTSFPPETPTAGPWTRLTLLGGIRESGDVLARKNVNCPAQTMGHEQGRLEPGRNHPASLKGIKQHLHPQTTRPQIISEAPSACSLLGVLGASFLSASPVSCLETGVEESFCSQ